jgi:hypothetical protein
LNNAADGCIQQMNCHSEEKADNKKGAVIITGKKQQ